MLFGGRQPRVQRDDFGVAKTPIAQSVCGVANFAFAGEEDQDVAFALRAQLVDSLADRVDGIAVEGDVAGFDSQWPVTHFDGERSPGYLDDRRGLTVDSEVLGEAFGIDGRRRDDDLEVGSAGEQLSQVPEDEVDVEAAFVRFVDDQRVVASEHTVALNFGEENAVGHELDVGAVRDLVGEPHGVSDGVAEFGVEFFGDTFGNGACCQPARLCVSDQTADATSEFETDLRDLGCLTRAGLAGDDDNLILRDRGRDVVLALTDGQGFGVRDRGNTDCAGSQACACLLDFFGQRHQSVWCAGAVEFATESTLVAE